MRFGATGRSCAFAAAVLAGGAAAKAAAPTGRGQTTHEEATRWAAEQLARLSLERKVAQMIWEPIQGEYIAQDDPRLARWMTLARDHGIGGFVVYGGTPNDTAGLLNRLQGVAQLPLLISADFEGGPGQQIKGATEFPANMALAAIGSETLAYEVGRAGAREGRAVGIHLTYSPVVDGQTRPDNPALGVRSFGAEVGLIGRLAAAYVRGYQDNGMLATAKHYPGRGDVDLIPKTEFLLNDKPAERVVAEDLAPFQAAIKAGVAFVMSEHIQVPALTDGSDLPASVNRTLATEWLRERLGFEGVLTTDDLWYPRVTRRFGPVRVAVLAVQAGHDAVLKPADAVATVQGLAAAVRAGEIPQAQIDASVRRLLYWKARLGLHRSRTVDMTRLAADVGIRPHLELASRIADESLTLARDRGFFPSTAAKAGRVVHVTIQRRERDAAPFEVATRLGAALDVKSTFHVGPGTGPAVRQAAVVAAREADTVVVSVFSPRRVYLDNGALSATDRELVAELAAARPASTIVMSYGNPYVVADAPDATAVLTGYGEGGYHGNQLVYADSFVRLLKGEIRPRGRLPVAVSAALAAGTGVLY
jgi:beta-N-acetylhexosaminidase